MARIFDKSGIFSGVYHILCPGWREGKGSSHPLMDPAVRIHLCISMHLQSTYKLNSLDVDVSTLTAYTQPWKPVLENQLNLISPVHLWNVPERHTVAQSRGMPLTSDKNRLCLTVYSTQYKFCLEHLLTLLYLEGTLSINVI